MNKLQKILGIGAIILSLTGCEKQYKTGTVIGEYGTVINSLVKSDDAILGRITANETVKLGNPTYLLQIKTTEGVYTASLFNYAGVGKVTLEALALAIKEGDKIKFPITDIDGTDYFNNSKIGRIDSNEVEILSHE